MLYAQVSKHLGFAHGEMERMDYVLFFGYVRRVERMIEQEKAAYKEAEQEAQAGREPEISEEEVTYLFPRARVWQGRTP